MKSNIWLWLVIGSLTLGRLGISSQLELAEDEAYYWLWSQQLSTGYFDHPPAIAYAIRLGTEPWAIPSRSPIGHHTSGRDCGLVGLPL